MKRFIQSLLLVAFFIGITVPAWGQTSTQGTDFWVALTLSANPGGGSFAPFIAISKQDTLECTVTITSPSNSSWNGVTVKTKAAWTVIPSDDLEASNWYDTDFASQAGKVQKQGLLVHSDKEISVFCAWQGTESFDASNILPVTVLQSDYIVQDYPPYDNDGNTSYSTFAIVATEDETIVDITPSEETYDNHAAGTTYQTPKLSKGQVYHVLSSKEKTLSGTRVTAQGKKKIAVFNGDVMTRVPDKKMGNRDLLYEQAMPTDYWGTQFVVTRSLRKDANRIRVTAMENGTTISINGKAVKLINSGKTYEFELAKQDFVPKSARESALPDSIIYADEAFISTSCPCAVYSYDVGKSYRGKDGATETSNDYGDPSMVWISPLEQRIKNITFGVCGTDYTKDHCINIVKLTADKTITLQNSNGDNMLTSSDVFIPVPGNTKYSYLRKLLVDNEDNVKESFTLTSESGVIAHIYGSGVNESYAYSAGSSAVSLGTITVGNQTFENGTLSKTPICVDASYTFDATAGTTIIDRVDWDFADGTTATVYEASTTHQYTSPGWYDVTAKLYAHKNCPDTVYPPFDVKFTFRVVEADTIPVGSAHDCIEADSTYKGVKLTAEEIQEMLTYGANDTAWEKRVNCYDPVEITFMTYGIKTTHRDTVNAKDSALVGGVWYYPETVPADSIVRDTIYDGNQYDCDSIIYHYLNITTCLEIEIAYNADAHVCEEKKMDVSYEITKGKAGGAAVAFDGQSPVTITLDQVTKGKSVVVLPTENLAPGKHRAVILIEDVNCKDTLSKAYDFAVYYPDSIFAQKFNNVLAVYKKGYGKNKGYDFTAYQWYYNDEAIPNATESIYHVDGKLASGTYYVVLTRADMEPLQSCPITVNADELPSYDKNSAPARKMIQNSRMVIVKDGRTYDIYGQRVE